MEEFINWVSVTPVMDAGEVIGYELTGGASKGHRRAGGCCSFNGGWCSGVADFDFIVDLDFNIVESNYTMFIGLAGEPGEDGNYLRFVEN